MTCIVPWTGAREVHTNVHTNVHDVRFQTL